MTTRAALPIRVLVADDSDGSVVAMSDRREQVHLPLRARNVATAISCPRPEQQTPVRSSRIRAMLTDLREIMAQWRRRVSIRNELMSLGDSDLRDIGWTRAEVEAERRKPFWRA